MDTDENYNLIVQTTNTWINNLDFYTLEELVKKPDAESWSLGQVYTHLVDATLNFHLANWKIHKN